MQQRGPRTKNFVVKEMEALVTVIENRRQELDTSRGHIKVRPKEMKKRWNQLAEDYCAVVTTKRSGSQCIKKWQDCDHVISRKVAHNKRERTRTGGGPANLHPLTPLEERVAALMGPAWRKTISTAQAGPTLEGEEPEANPEDAKEDSDADEPEEGNIFQSNPPGQERGERGGGNGVG
uniref:myb-related transcription factor, partner of profilin-like n=1 Tax=Pristiophorus japonicus TaxID=55135 RepID=UPI00398E603F